MSALIMFCSYKCMPLKIVCCLYKLTCLCLSDFHTVWVYVWFWQPPRLISMQQLPRGPGGMNGGPGAPMYPSSHHMRLPGPAQGRMPTAQPRHNGQQYPPMMQPQLQRQVSMRSLWFHCMKIDEIMYFGYSFYNWFCFLCHTFVTVYVGLTETAV